MLAHYQSLMAKMWSAACMQRPEWISTDELLESSAVTIATCIALTILWPLGVFLAARSSKSFAALSNNKKWYVIANLSKVVCLAIVCIHPTFFTDLWDLYEGRIIESDTRAIWIKRSTALYVSSDIVALLMVPKLPSTTVAHHVITMLLASALFATRISQANITLMIGVYGAWSSLAWLVNLFLAFRCVFRERWWMNYLASLAMIQYATVCFANWSWHAIWFWNQMVDGNVLLDWYGFLVLAYAVAVAVVARDDLVLLKWLWNFTQQRQRLICDCEDKQT
jgi:hypothetical protein